MLCNQVTGVGPIVDFALKATGLDARPIDVINQLDWAEIIKKAEAQKDQKVAWDEQRQQWEEQQAKQKQEMEDMMNQQVRRRGGPAVVLR